MPGGFGCHFQHSSINQLIAALRAMISSQIALNREI
jgi:hypothetical protein